MVSEKRGGVEGKREGSFNIYVPPLPRVYSRPNPPPFFTPLRTALHVACENIRFSSLLAAGDVSRGGTTDVFAGYAACHAGQKRYNIVNNN